MLSECNLLLILVAVSPVGGSTRETELMRSLQLLLDMVSRGERPVIQDLFAQKGDNVNVLLGDIQVQFDCRFSYNYSLHLYIFNLFSLNAASGIFALAPRALLHYFKDLYNSLSSPVINTTSISEFNARSSKTFQTATINQ